MRYLSNNYVLQICLRSTIRTPLSAEPDNVPVDVVDSQLEACFFNRMSVLMMV